MADSTDDLLRQILAKLEAIEENTAVCADGIRQIIAEREAAEQEKLKAMRNLYGESDD